MSYDAQLSLLHPPTIDSLRRYKAVVMLGQVWLQVDPEGWLYDADQVDHVIKSLQERIVALEALT